VYGQDPPDCLGRDVYLLDFSYKRAVMDQIIALARSVTVLDHHKTAQAEMDGLVEYWHREVPNLRVSVRFDMEKSGARLAWEWFHPGEAVPQLVRYVEDRDLWRFAVPYSKEINAALFSYDYDFARWNLLRAMLEAGSPILEAAGEAIERKQAKDVKELVGKLKHRRAFTKCWAEHPYFVPCANLPYTLASDAAGLMAEDASFAATYYQDADGWFVFSLRSRGAGADVSEVAKCYGGGGHRNAAGFRVKSLEEL
jgi:oligoribonuclease NrnB/cAMP/cGMP phosphodiesterase (DHH superfamily)